MEKLKDHLDKPEKQDHEEPTKTGHWCGSKFLKSFCAKTLQGSKWLWKDLKQPHLFWVKVIFMLQSASLVTLYPYLIVHLRSLGFTIEDASIVNTAVPLADIIAPPVAGLLADKLGNFRIFMVAITFLNGAASLLLLTVEGLSVQNQTASSNNLTFPVELCCVTSELNQTLCYDIMGGLNMTSLKSDSLLSCSSLEDNSNKSVTSFPATLVEGFQSESSCLRSNCSSDSGLEPKQQNNGTKRRIKGTSNNWTLPVFWHYLGIRVILDIFRASSLMLFEGAVVAIIKEHGGDYGLQKLFGTLGAVIFGPLSGQLIDMEQKKNSSQSNPAGAYMSVILLYFALRTVTAVCLLKVSLGFKPPAKKVVNNVWQVMRKTEVLAFLAAFLVSGILWGFLENFLFWLLEDLGSTKFLMGMSLAVGTLAGLPLTIFSGMLVKKIGYSNIMLLSLVLYAVRIAGYSLFTKPEWFLLLEALKPFCTTLLLIAVFSFIKSHSPLTTAATVESIFGASYFGVGRGVGGLIGGFAIYDLGVTVTFRMVAAMAAVTAFIYGMIMELRRRWGSKKFILPQI